LHRYTLSFGSLSHSYIIISHIENISAKYIMAVLNSDVARFYYTHKWKSIKVLRSYLEEIPIPDPGDKQEIIISLVEEIENSSPKEFEELYKKLNIIINDLYDFKP